MSSTFTLSAFIVCDDIRSEATGKDMLIGVYADAIILPRFPARLPKLCFRVTVTDITVEKPKAFTFYVHDTEGKARLQFEQVLPDNFPTAHSTFTFVANSPAFDKPTELVASFGIDCVPTPIGRIAIREAATDDERARIQLTHG